MWVRWQFKTYFGVKPTICDYWCYITWRYVQRCQTNIYGWWFQYHYWYRWYSTTELGWSSMTPLTFDLFKPWSLCGDHLFQIALAMDLGIWMEVFPSLDIPLTLGLTNWPISSLSKTHSLARWIGCSTCGSAIHRVFGNVSYLRLYQNACPSISRTLMEYVALLRRPILDISWMIVVQFFAHFLLYARLVHPGSPEYNRSKQAVDN